MAVCSCKYSFCIHLHQTRTRFTKRCSGALMQPVPVVIGTICFGAVKFSSHSGRPTLGVTHVQLDASGLFFVIVRYGGECWLHHHHHHTVNVQKVGLHVQNLKDLDIPHGTRSKHSLEPLILNIQALSKLFSFFTCAQLVFCDVLFSRCGHTRVQICLRLQSWAFLVTVVLIAAICVVKANKREPWKLNDEISKQTKTHAGLLHPQLLCIYMGKTPAPRVCGGPFRGQYYNTVN